MIFLPSSKVISPEVFAGPGLDEKEPCLGEALIFPPLLELNSHSPGEE